MDRHQLALARSLEAHREIARRLDPSMVARAATRLERWTRDERIHPEWARLWREALALPLPELAESMTRPDAADLRQTSPFAGELPPRERWAIWKAVA